MSRGAGGGTTPSHSVDEMVLEALGLGGAISGLVGCRIVSSRRGLSFGRSALGTEIRGVKVVIESRVWDA
jgi:hypothetical protein